MTAEKFLSRLDRVRRTEGGWMARCPAHADRSPSLSIAEGDDGRLLLHCHAGCTIDQVVGAMGLTLGDLFPGDGRPLRSQRYQGVSRRDITDQLEHESIVLLSAIGHRKKRCIPNPKDEGRDKVAARRIVRALRVLYEI